jgi:hypothetical protein
LATLGKPTGATARGQEAEVADSDEAPGEHVKQEAVEKRVDVERERPHLIAMAVVLPPE